MNTDSLPDLSRLCADLEQAARRDLRGAQRHRAPRAVLVVALVSAVGTGGAAAAGVFSPDDVATAMPEGSALFGSIQPDCTLDDDGVTYRCTLDSPPDPTNGDPLASAHYQSYGYEGDRQLLGIDERVGGGCIGVNAEGTRWRCYLGDEAVAHDVFIKEFLGHSLRNGERGGYYVRDRLGIDQLEGLDETERLP